MVRFRFLEKGPLFIVVVVFLLGTTRVTDELKNLVRMGIRVFGPTLVTERRPKHDP